MPVMCVIKHLVKGGKLSHTSLYIVASVLICVVCVKTSGRDLLCIHISVYIVASVSMPVMCVITHSVKSQL